MDILFINEGLRYRIFFFNFHLSLGISNLIKYSFHKNILLPIVLMLMMININHMKLKC